MAKNVLIRTALCGQKRHEECKGRVILTWQKCDCWCHAKPKVEGSDGR